MSAVYDEEDYEDGYYAPTFEGRWINFLPLGTKEWPWEDATEELLDGVPLRVKEHWVGVEFFMHHLPATPWHKEVFRVLAEKYGKRRALLIMRSKWYRHASDWTEADEHITRAANEWVNEALKGLNPISPYYLEEER